MDSEAGIREHEETSKTYTLPGASQKGLACCWRQGNTFTVYPRSQTPHQATEESPPQKPSEQTIFHVHRDIILFTPIIRKLVNESNGTFLSAQKCAAETSNNVELLKISRQYRSVIRACLQNLQEAVAKAKNESEKTALTSYVTIFYSIECIWHLSEILYVDNIPGDVVLPFLLEWVRFHFPCHEQAAAQLLEACERGSEEHEAYWDTVLGMVVQGRVDVARALLRLHSAADSNEFKLVDNALRTMPTYSVYGGVSAGEFGISWKHWQLDCRSRLSSHCFRTEPRLELIMRLLSGEYAAFEEMRDKYESWFDVLGGWVLYTEPAARGRDLGRHAAACAGMRPPRRPRRQLDAVLLALMEDDLHQVIHEIQNIADNGWFATHLTDLLYHCGKLKILDEHQVNVTNRLRESLILEYGSTLMEHRSLWAAGLSYLTACPGEGPRRAALLLERLPLGSEARALRILGAAGEHTTHSVVSQVCGAAGARCAARDRPGAALAWALRGRCGALATRAADQLLRGYAATGRLRCADVLLTLGPAMLLSERLVFLGKYCEFHRLYKNREFKEAGQLLVSLLTSKITPNYFWGTLLLDALPLLECDEPVLSSAGTFEVMAALEYHSGDLADPDKVELLRLALSRNLSRTMLEDEDELEND